MEKSISLRVLTETAHISWLIILFIPGLISGQNLIKNPSFEHYNDCPDSYSNSHKDFSLPCWYSPTKSSPDYFNSCSSLNVNVPNNFMGHVWAKDGNAYIGLLLYELPKKIENNKHVNYREYVQTKITSALVKDSTYFFSLYFCAAPYSRFLIKKIGVCISEERLKGKYSRIQCSGNLLELEIANFTDETGIWTEFQKSFKSSGKERYITIGNFNSDIETNYIRNDISLLRNSLQQTIKSNGYAYYFIDKVQLTKSRSK